MEQKKNKEHDFDKEQIDSYKEIDFKCKTLACEKRLRTYDKGICFWCEKNKAEFPTGNPIPVLCSSCFVSILEDELKLKIFSIQNKLKNIKDNPSNFAKLHEKEIITLMQEKNKELNKIIGDK